MKIFKNILSFLKLDAATTKVELSEEQKEKIDLALGELQTITTERDGLKTKVSELETAATTSSSKITELEGQVSTLTTDNTKQKTEIERLGALDAGKFTKTKGQEEIKTDAGAIEFSESHKESLEKAKNL